MTNPVHWQNYPAAASLYLSAQLDGLADGANKLGGVIDNTSNGDMYMDAELYIATQPGARSAGAFVALYILASVDNVNYCYGTDAVDPPSSALVCNLDFDAVATARLHTKKHILLPAGRFKMLVINETGQAFAAANNTLKYKVYGEEIR